MFSIFAMLLSEAHTGGRGNIRIIIEALQYALS